MGLVKSFTAALVAAAAAVAITPRGFQPQVAGDLRVIYGETLGENGAALKKSQTQGEPVLATADQLSGIYAVVMVDLDVPTSDAKTVTLLHWMQTGLSSSSSATTLALADGSSTEGFVLKPTASTAALATYLGPSPPPGRQPPAHRYTLLLVEHTDISEEGLTALTDAAASRRGFDVMRSLDAAGLADRVVAGNFFTVRSAPGNSTAGGGPGPTGTFAGGGPPMRTGGSPAATSALENRAERLTLPIGLLFVVATTAWTVYQ